MKIFLDFQSALFQRALSERIGADFASMRAITRNFVPSNQWRWSGDNETR